jgi:BolA protein
MSIKDVIYKTIAESFMPEKLEIIDESNKHAGHAGSHPQGESHFLIRISASAFAGKSRVEREKLLRKAIDTATPRDIHSISFEFVS